MPKYKNHNPKSSPAIEEFHASADTASLRARLESERMSRRQALRKMGIMSGVAIFALISTDDLARLAATKLRENEATRGIGETLAKDLRSAGIAFANTSGNGYFVPDTTDIVRSCKPIKPGKPMPNGNSCFDCGNALESAATLLNIQTLAIEAGMPGSFTVPSSRAVTCGAEAEDTCNNTGSGTVAMNDYVRCMVKGLVSDAIISSIIGALEEAVIAGG